MKDSIEQKWVMICKYMNEFDEEYHKLASYYKLSDSSFWILYELYQNKNGCTQKELYTDWYLNKQTINSSVKYLINKKYIMVEYLDNNKKSKRLKLTNKGKKMAKNTVGRVMRLETKVFKDIDENEMDRVINFFRKQTILFKGEVSKVIKREEDKDE